MRISYWSSDVCSSDLITHKCADALDYAHGRGVLHRDIKPSNIMLTRDGVPKLMDFSIAEINPAGRAGTQGGQSVLGSPLYMSPERSEEHTSELQSLMRISYAVFCLKKNNTYKYKQQSTHNTY